MKDFAAHVFSVSLPHFILSMEELLCANLPRSRRICSSPPQGFNLTQKTLLGTICALDRKERTGLESKHGNTMNS